MFHSQAKTEMIHNAIKNAPDQTKLYFAINWRIPHSVFNVACRVWPGSNLQNIDWYQIHKSYDLGAWSHGGRVQTITHY